MEADQTPVGADNKLFRRGVILGLTLAEISLLIVFVLMLVFGGLLRHQQTALVEAQQMARDSAAARAQLRKALRDLAPGVSEQQIDGWVKDLIASGVKEQDNRALKSQLAKAEAALDRIRDEVRKDGLGDPGPEPADKAAQWERTAERVEQSGQRLRAGQEAQRAMEKGGDEAQKALAAAKLENDRLKGTVANAQRKLADAGKGTEKPACWATADGRPEYIFEITLTAGGIRIHDRALPTRRAQQALLPLSTIQFDQPLSVQAYRTETQPLFDWGEQNDCRFFVIAVDGTGPAQKEIFKQRLRVMEEHFYKYLSN